MADYVKLTPLAGGKNDISGVCSLLEIGNYTILLDCGCSTKNANNLLHKIQSTLSTIGKSINAVILSHADLQHLGALPVVLGANGISLANTSVVCTLPVHKFGQLVLYDYCSNIEMEGNPDIIKSEFSKKNNHEFPKFDYDDIDHCFYRPTIVKFSQMIELPGSSINKRSQDSKPIHICAYPSGRTIGGAIWRIRHGSTEVLYAVDMNMKNEVVLAGASTDPLPSVPSLLIIDAGTSAQLTTLQTVATAGKGKGRKDKEDPQALISNILDTLRNEGNVLLPCETAGRTLELIQTLGTYWAMNKVGLYHLILLSPMAYNVLEFARSQLEWMRDSLAKQFYNGSSNPFELSYLKICTSVREMERLYPGPKVVLSTDSGLSCGLSKEILLRWGGDPRCRVIFTDASETNSLGYELRTAVPPVVVTINRPIRVELCGEELNEHRKQEERKRKEVEDDEQRKTRENELEFLAQANQDEDDEVEDDRTDQDSSTADDGHSQSALALTASINNSLQSPLLKRSSTEKSATSAVATTAGKRRRVQSSLLLKFLNPDFPMFHNREPQWIKSEFGVLNDDLFFNDPAVAELASKNQTTIGRLGNGESQGNGTGNNSTLTKGVAGITSVLEIPTKVVSTPVTVQFTCSFSETPIAGCADTKVVKFLITKLAPSRVVVIRGSVSDCDSLVSYAKTIQIDAHAPFNGETIAFTIPVDRIRLQIPLSLMPKRLHVVRGLNASSKETQCSIVPIAGNVLEVASSSSRGLRTLRLQSLTEPQLSVVAPSTMSLTGVGYTNRDTKSGLSTGKFKAVSAVGSISATTTGAAPQVNVSLVDDFFASMFGSTSAASDSNAAALFDLDIASGIVSSTTIDASGIPIDPTATDSLEAILAGVSAPTEVTSLENILESSSETQVAPVCSDTMLIDESDVTVQVAATAVAEVEEADFEDMPMEIDTVDKSEDDEDGEEEVEGMYAGAIDSSAELSAELHTLLLRPYTVVSVGEVTLNSVKTLLESLGFSVEFKISQSGAALVCDSQVVIRKSDQMNDFILEGPPTRAFWEAKKVLKEKFAYIT